MTATTTRKTTAKPAPAKPATGTRSRTTKPAPGKAAEQPKVAPKTKPAKPEAKTLVEALTTGQAVLIKVGANGTVRSLPYLAPSTPQRKDAEAVSGRVASGEAVTKIAEDLSVSLATARRFLTNLALAHEVEAGKHDKAWTKGTKNVPEQRAAARGRIAGEFVNWQPITHHSERGWPVGLALLDVPARSING